jgi:hypothetical protein
LDSIHRCANQWLAESHDSKKTIALVRSITRRLFFQFFREVARRPATACNCACVSLVLARRHSPPLEKSSFILKDL